MKCMVSTNLFWKYSGNKSILECGISTKQKHDEEEGIFKTNTPWVETYAKRSHTKTKKKKKKKKKWHQFHKADFRRTKEKHHIEQRVPDRTF